MKLSLMQSHLVHAILSYGIPLLGGFGIGRLTRDRARTRRGRVIWCLIAIAGSVILQYFGFMLFLEGMGDGTDDETGFIPVGLLVGLLWFSLPAAFKTVPLTVVGYWYGSRWRSRPQSSPSARHRDEADRARLGGHPSHPVDHVDPQEPQPES